MLGTNKLPPNQICYVLWYCESINRFIDERGNVMHNLSGLFPLWQLEEWKRTQKYDYMLDRRGVWCELCYLREETYA